MTNCDCAFKLFGIKRSDRLKEDSIKTICEKFLQLLEHSNPQIKSKISDKIRSINCSEPKIDIDRTMIILTNGASSLIDCTSKQFNHNCGEIIQIRRLNRLLFQLIKATDDESTSNLASQKDINEPKVLAEVQPAQQLDNETESCGEADLMMIAKPIKIIVGHHYRGKTQVNWNVVYESLSSLSEVTIKTGELIANMEQTKNNDAFKAYMGKRKKAKLTILSRNPQLYKFIKL